MESRAAVFTSRPQDIEVYHGAAWLPGSMLGWRHDASGGCQVWVRLAYGSDEIWTGLECVRLPERHLAVAPEPVEGADDDRSATPSSAVRSEVRELTFPRGLPAIRGALAPTGRSAHPAGRRRAAETAESPAVGAGLSAVPAGRHRAPAPPAGSAGAGRHRAADTGVWPVLADPDATAEMPRAWTERSGDDTRPGPRLVVADAVGPLSAEPDLLTRPMRLADAVPQPRSGRLHDPLGGV